MANNDLRDSTRRTWKGRGGRGHNRKGSARSGRGGVHTESRGKVKDKKVFLFVPYTAHNSTVYHTFKDTKRNYVETVALRLGEYSVDIRNALEKEVPYAESKPVRDKATEMTVTQPMRPIQLEGESSGDFQSRIDQYEFDLIAYQEAKATHDFEQSTLDMYFKARVNDWEKRANAYARNKTKAFDLLMKEYCHKTLKERLEGQSDWETTVQGDPVETLKRIRVLSHSPTRGRYPFAVITESVERFINVQQQQKESVTFFLDRFKQNVDVLESYLGGSIVDPYTRSLEAYEKASDDDKAKMIEENRKAFNTFVFFRKLDQHIFGSLFRKWTSEYAQQIDHFPKDLDEAKEVCDSHRSDAVNEQKLMNKVTSKSGQGERHSGDVQEGAQQGTSFAQKSSDKFCYCCGSPDHMSFDCSKKNTLKDQWYVNKMHSHLQQEDTQSTSQETGTTGDTPDNSTVTGDDNNSTPSGSSPRTWYGPAPQRSGQNHCMINRDDVGCLLHQQDGASIKDQIILDTGSTMDLFCNRDLLEGDPFLADVPIYMLTNAGQKVHRYQGRVPGFASPVWFDPQAITNIMSMASLKTYHDVAYDPMADKFIISHRGAVIAEFKSNQKGLYVYTPVSRKRCRDSSESHLAYRSDRFSKKP